MSIDVYMFTGEEYSKEKGYTDEYHKFDGKDDGATGYLLRPVYSFPRDDDSLPVDFDFINETPKVIKYILKIILVNIVEVEDLTTYFDEPIDTLIDIKNDAKLTVVTLEKVKAVLKNLKIETSEYDQRWLNRCIEMVDFFLLGVKLQLAGKHPMVLEF